MILIAPVSIRQNVPGYLDTSVLQRYEVVPCSNDDFGCVAVEPGDWESSDDDRFSGDNDHFADGESVSAENGNDEVQIGDDLHGNINQRFKNLRNQITIETRPDRSTGHWPSVVVVRRPLKMKGELPYANAKMSVTR